MTTIIIDGNTRSIYTDSRGTQTETTSIVGTNETQETLNYLTVLKCYAFADGYICGTGDLDLLQSCIGRSAPIHSFTLPKLNKKHDNTRLMYVRLKGEVLEVTEYSIASKFGLFGTKKYWKNTTKILKNTALFYGSGADYAQGAYQIIQDPVKAIVAASQCDIYTDCDVRVYSFDKQ